MQSVLEALQVFLPGVFVVLIVWLGARAAVGGDITPGELVAFYGYAAFLMIPLRTVTEFANKLIRARVSARRVCKVLAQHPDVVDPATPAASPPPGSDLSDDRTGFRARAGTLVAIVADQPDESAHLADRLGLTAAEPDDDVRLGGVPLTSLRRDEVRSRILVSDTGTTLFSGRLARPPRRRRPRGSRPGARHGLGGGRPRRPSRRARRGGHRARPLVLRRPATATRPRPRAHRRPGGARARRAHVGGRRAHRGADRGSSRRPPGRADHRRDVVQPADARRGRRGRLPLRRDASSPSAATTTCSRRTRPTARSSPARRRPNRTSTGRTSSCRRRRGDEPDRAPRRRLARRASLRQGHRPAAPAPALDGDRPPRRGRPGRAGGAAPARRPRPGGPGGHDPRATSTASWCCWRASCCWPRC